MRALAALLLLPSLAAARPLAVVVHTYPGVSDADFDEVRLGVELFARLAREHCGEELAPVVTRDRRDGDPGDWGYTDAAEPVELAGGGREPLRWYQAAVYRLTTRERLPLREGQLDLFVRPRWENCGTSFPAVQLGADAPRARPWVVDRVLLVSRSGSGDCGDYTRVVAHELGHLFVQDDPPHRCPLADGRMVPCDGDNLLAHTVQGGRRDELYERLASGTALTPLQCERLRRPDASRRQP